MVPRTAVLFCLRAMHALACAHVENMDWAMRARHREANDEPLLAPSCIYGDNA